MQSVLGKTVQRLIDENADETTVHQAKMILGRSEQSSETSSTPRIGSALSATAQSGIKTTPVVVVDTPAPFPLDSTSKRERLMPISKILPAASPLNYPSMEISDLVATNQAMILLDQDIAQNLEFCF
ncbi:hypothetical protein FSARC_7874 [Fusarium sarcochroum]|uniref:Uncharacterized protein n=1 Tax=Fusarium sarcochroum TaxID=1208366 RepID=A0A8H4TUB3_9HYPO|nr:hypothetical protein FSARC_7874 [Fusarium sarcochroum]